MINVGLEIHIGMDQLNDEWRICNQWSDYFCVFWLPETEIFFPLFARKHWLENRKVSTIINVSHFRASNCILLIFSIKYPFSESLDCFSCLLISPQTKFKVYGFKWILFSYWDFFTVKGNYDLICILTKLPKRSKVIRNYFMYRLV